MIAKGKGQPLYICHKQLGRYCTVDKTYNTTTNVRFSPINQPIDTPIDQSTNRSIESITQRHPLNTIHQRPPAIRLQLSVLDALLRPVLMRPRDPPDHALEEDDLVAHALLDEDAARVLVDDGLLVLFCVA
jgi:hypothetical protein